MGSTETRLQGLQDGGKLKEGMTEQHTVTGLEEQTTGETKLPRLINTSKAPSNGRPDLKWAVIKSKDKIAVW